MPEKTCAVRVDRRLADHADGQLALAHAWLGWPPVLERSLLEPCPEVGVLHGAATALLSARDLARVLLLSCKTLRQRLATATDIKYGLLRHRLIGSLSALEVSAHTRHQWSLAKPFAGDQALRWLDGLERALFFEDFGSNAILPETTGPAACRQWMQLGPLEAPAEHGEIRCVELASERSQHTNSGFHSAEGCESARCATLRIARTYGQTTTHFGRGLCTWLVPPAGNEGLRPRNLSFLLRWSIGLYDGVGGARRGAHESVVGYMVLSDGCPTGSSSQGLFGTEALFLYIHVHANHRASLEAVNGANEGMRVITDNIRPDSWLQVRARLDWERHEAFFAVDDFASAHYGVEAPPWRQTDEVRVKFRGVPAEGLKQLTLLSVADRGHSRVSWTDITLTDSGLFGSPARVQQ